MLILYVVWFGLVWFGLVCLGSLPHDRERDGLVSGRFVPRPRIYRAPTLDYRSAEVLCISLVRYQGGDV